MTTTQTKVTSNGKPSKGKAQPVITEVTAPWYAEFNARITAANGELGTVPTADHYRAGQLIGGPDGKPKRQGVEALYLALVLRPEGCSPEAFITVKGRHGKAENALHYASSNLSRA